MVNLIKQQFTLTRQGVMQALEGVSPEMADVIPFGFNNNIRWQVGHILYAGELHLFPGKGTLPAEYANFFDSGTRPRQSKEGVPSLKILIAELKEQYVRIQNIPEEAFNEKLSRPRPGLETFGEFAAMMAYHEAMHLGQIQSLKRVVQAKGV
ncbi:DinB family protein [Paenibacillus rhizovicinus]|uniref:DinB family protein n=1 Tax=Paenibacillus rhizovicinus TaxID=2704463 RepID=A0A6C0P1W8_9BACL|nr:DinB family protein [Paenibacillus rhizovicinus]QHW32236.1 DinB family protein [Paenibacillus rhizovicinus]